MKNFYYAYIIEFENKKHLASWDKVSSCENIVYELHKYDGINYGGSRGKIVAANMCETKKEAVTLTNDWNDAFRENGTYIYTREREAEKEAIA